jgi:hypothetical protein
MTLKGRLILLFSIYTYIKIYKKNALTLYITDLTIGLDDYEKIKVKKLKKWINLLCKKVVKQ